MVGPRKAASNNPGTDRLNAVIVKKTDLGLKVLKDRSVPLTPRQRAAFILADGRRSFGEVMLSTAGMGVTSGDLEHLIASGLISRIESPVTDIELDLSAPALVAGARTSQERYRDAYPLATQLTAALGLRGFRLNLAVESVGSFEQLAELAPKIEQAVGREKFAALARALND
jgi:hypothetical protein